MRRIVSITVLAILIIGVCHAEDLIIRMIDVTAPQGEQKEGTFYIKGLHDPWGKDDKGNPKSTLKGLLFTWDEVKQKWDDKVQVIVPAEYEQKQGLNTWYYKNVALPSRYKVKVFLYTTSTTIPSKVVDKEFVVPAK